MLDDIERRLARLEWAAQFPPEPVHAGRLLIAFCIGIVATLAWQSYGGAVREMIANSSPRLSWLAPSAVSVLQADPAAFSPDQKELKAISSGLAGLQQRVDQIAAPQEQMAGDITNRLQAVEQDIADKISVPAQPARCPSAQAPFTAVSAGRVPTRALMELHRAWHRLGG
jgi:hypothetical protein